jgi:murein DD-endopeptidase MepM/ murein hydrolase activator NlpD
MTVPLRVAAVCATAMILWSAAASRVAEQARLPVDAVVVGAVVTQPFGCTALALEPFDPSCPTRHVHTGIDLAAASGTPVHAATGGRARVGFDSRGAGLYVAVAVDAHVRILYCHLSSVDIATGQAVTAGQVIGAVGASGLATGPHLHLEIQVDGRSVDPAEWLASSPP